MKYYLLALRPHQWTKNLLIFAALIFSKNFFNKNLFLQTLEGFFLFSFLAGHVYIINDIIDREKDKLHPQKKNRPIPSGKLSVKTAIILTIFFIPAILLTAYWKINPNFFWISFIYFIMQIFYSFYLKNIIIADVMIISIGFLLRAIVGIVIIKVKLSHWLLLCSFWLALFLALAKRRSELESIEKGEKTKTRISLKFYSLPLLDKFITIITSTTILSYALYTIDPATVAKFKTDKLILTLPFVIYGLFRYLYLLYEKNACEKPEHVLISDKHILFTLILWIISITILIY